MSTATSYSIPSACQPGTGTPGRLPRAAETKQLILAGGAQPPIPPSLDPESTVSRHNRALLEAIRGGTLIDIERELQSGANPNVGAKESQQTPLHLAAKTLHLMRWQDRSAEIIQRLIATGARIDICGPDGWTPLHCAIRYSNLPGAGALLRAGANILARTTAGNAPVSIALGGLGRPMQKDMSARALAVLEFLLASGASLDGISLHDALHGPDIPAVAAALVKAGVSLEENLGDSGTALHRAAERGHCRTAAYLIDAGLSIDLRDTKGRTAQEIAGMLHPNNQEMHALFVAAHARKSIRCALAKRLAPATTSRINL